MAVAGAQEGLELLLRLGATETCVLRVCVCVWLGQGWVGEGGGFMCACVCACVCLRVLVRVRTPEGTAMVSPSFSYLAEGH
jgi:hypothetical protein